MHLFSCKCSDILQWPFGCSKTGFLTRGVIFTLANNTAWITFTLLFVVTILMAVSAGHAVVGRLIPVKYSDTSITNPGSSWQWFFKLVNEDHPVPI